MKCNNCQTEWNDNGNFSDLKNCPFCGKLLKSDKIVIDNNTSFGSVLKEIEKIYGKGIWKDRAKAVSAFRDLAPKMKTERLLLMIALECQMNEIFEKEKESAVSKAKIRLMNSLGEHPIENILLAFSELHDIETEIERINKVVTANTKVNSLKIDKKSNVNCDKIKSGEEKIKNSEVSKFDKKTFDHAITNNEDNKFKTTFTFADLKVGDTLDFGEFNGRKIKWRVLEKDEFSIFVISTEILCDRMFDSNRSNIWFVSELRKWLNDEFYNASFTANEKAKIKLDKGNNVTLLSEEEAVLFMSKEERGLGSWWWLRSHRANSRNNVCYVLGDGNISGSDAIYDGGVRPALYLKL